MHPTASICLRRGRRTPSLPDTGSRGAGSLGADHGRHAVAGRTLASAQRGKRQPANPSRPSATTALARKLQKWIVESRNAACPLSLHSRARRRGGGLSPSTECFLTPQCFFGERRGARWAHQEMEVRRPGLKQGIDRGEHLLESVEGSGSEESLRAVFCERLCRPIMIEACFPKHFRHLWKNRSIRGLEIAQLDF